MNCKSKLKSGGFTLIEILMVVAIIFVLGAIAFPVIVRQVHKGNEARALSMIKDIEVAVSLYAQDNHDLLPLPLDAEEDIDDDSIIDTDTDIYFIRALLGYSEGMNNGGGKIYFGSAFDTQNDGYGIQLDGNNDAVGFTDPWGVGYKIIADYSGDGEIVPNSIAPANDPDDVSKHFDPVILHGRSFGFSLGGLEVDDGGGNLTYPRMIYRWKN
jgi:prepilin-type N-terminal cleavage/methylation domain-containing protein